MQEFVSSSHNDKCYEWGDIIYHLFTLRFPKLSKEMKINHCGVNKEAKWEVHLLLVGCYLLLWWFIAIIKEETPSLQWKNVPNKDKIVISVRIGKYQ